MYIVCPEHGTWWLELPRFKEYSQLRKYVSLKKAEIWNSSHPLEVKGVHKEKPKAKR